MHHTCAIILRTLFVALILHYKFGRGIFTKDDVNTTSSLLMEEESKEPNAGPSLQDQRTFSSDEERETGMVVENKVNEVLEQDEALEGEEEHLQNLTSEQSDLITDTDSIGSGRTLRTSNYASLDAGAIVLDTSEGFKSASNILKNDKDRYMMCPCENPKKWIVVSLSEDVHVDAIAISNYEKFSSPVKDFWILGSANYPTETWKMLGNFTAQDVHGEQVFPIPVHHVRYIKVRFLSYYGSEYYCTLSQLRVFGQTLTEVITQLEKSFIDEINTINHPQPEENNLIPELPDGNHDTIETECTPTTLDVLNVDELVELQRRLMSSCSSEILLSKHQCPSWKYYEWNSGFESLKRCCVKQPHWVHYLLPNDENKCPETADTVNGYMNETSKNVTIEIENTDVLPEHQDGIENHPKVVEQPTSLPPELEENGTITSDIGKPKDGLEDVPRNTSSSTTLNNAEPLKQGTSLEESKDEVENEKDENNVINLEEKTLNTTTTMDPVPPVVETNSHQQNEPKVNKLIPATPAFAPLQNIFVSITKRVQVLEQNQSATDRVLKELVLTLDREKTVLKGQLDQLTTQMQELQDILSRESESNAVVNVKYHSELNLARQENLELRRELGVVHQVIMTLKAGLAVAISFSLVIVLGLGLRLMWKAWSVIRRRRQMKRWYKLLQRRKQEQNEQDVLSVLASDSRQEMDSYIVDHGTHKRVVYGKDDSLIGRRTMVSHLLAREPSAFRHHFHKARLSSSPRGYSSLALPALSEGLKE